MANYASGSVHGVVLLPNDDASQQCIDASSRLDAVSPSLVTLNTSDSRAHLTVVHVTADLSSADALWKSIVGQVNAADLESLALYLRPSEGTTWVGFDVRKTNALVALHNAVVDACQSEGLEILTEHGDAYWPHITLGRWPVLPSQQLPLDDIAFGRLGHATPALALMSEHGVVSKVISTL